MHSFSKMNQDFIDNLVTRLIPVLTRRITQYHEMFSLPLIAEQWEETLHRSLDEVGYKTTWEPIRSHAIGEDMRLVGVDNSRISCKSGQFINDRTLHKACVKFNGSRSTRFPTIDEKIGHFSASQDDYYFLLAKHKKFNNQYKLIIFESILCRADKLAWTESASKKSWNGCGDFSAVIGKSMSAQLWTTLPLDMIRHAHDIVIDRT